MFTLKTNVKTVISMCKICQNLSVPMKNLNKLSKCCNSTNFLLSNCKNSKNIHRSLKIYWEIELGIYSTRAKYSNSSSRVLNFESKYHQHSCPKHATDWKMPYVICIIFQRNLLNIWRRQYFFIVPFHPPSNFQKNH